MRKYQKYFHFYSIPSFDFKKVFDTVKESAVIFAQEMY